MAPSPSHHASEPGCRQGSQTTKPTDPEQVLPPLSFMGLKPLQGFNLWAALGFNLLKHLIKLITRTAVGRSWCWWLQDRNEVMSCHPGIAQGQIEPLGPHRTHRMGSIPQHQ